MLQACEAIAEAHALGIVHRDLKPANLFLAQRARRLAARQGARLRHLEDRRSRRSASASLMTTTAAVMGSPLYMSPEQMRVDAGRRRAHRHLGARRHPLRAALEAASVSRRVDRRRGDQDRDGAPPPLRPSRPTCRPASRPSSCSASKRIVLFATAT